VIDFVCRHVNTFADQGWMAALHAFGGAGVSVFETPVSQCPLIQAFAYIVSRDSR